uniref:Uncharacterized protein n=1 Tax=Marseillevirus LCMAC101 TaxID=2506602 RepID=A0A481YSQ9_9VIRU|nr:MAG: hypothetical protein LCMAC101_05720 [Marseillevirus LCMAC101]
MEPFSFDWEFGTKLPPTYVKKYYKKSPLYISLWKCLENSPYVYTRQFHNWGLYTLFIVRTFSDININDFKDDINTLLRELYIVHNNENMEINTHYTTNDVLNAFLDKLREEDTEVES